MDVARVYDQPHEPELRVLVDRLWPRGISKDDPRVGQWLPGVAPSTALRRWYGHRPELFAEFSARYENELADPDRAASLEQLLNLCRAHSVTLVTATREITHSHVAVLARLIDDAMGSSDHDTSDDRGSVDLDRLTRWDDAGGTWQVVSVRGGSATIALCRCDGGEEVDRFTSDDPELLAYVKVPQRDQD